MRMIPETRVFIEVEVFARGAWWPGVVEHWRELNGRREAWVRYTTGVGENRLGWFSVEAVRPVMSPMQDAHDEGALGPLFEQTQ